MNKKVSVYGTADQELTDVHVGCCIGMCRMACDHSPGGSTFRRKMMSRQPNYVECVTSSRKSDSVSRCVFSHIYSKNIPAKFHPDPIWNEGALGFFEEVTPTRRRRQRFQQQIMLLISV